VQTSDYPLLLVAAHVLVLMFLLVNHLLVACHHQLEVCAMAAPEV
jgi:hypothetical protein